MSSSGRRSRRDQLRELLGVICQRGRSRRRRRSRQRYSRSMQMSSTSRRHRSGAAECETARPGSPRSRAGRGGARPARSGGLAIRIPRQASSCRSASRSRIRASDRRTERSERPVSSAISESCEALQPEFQHPPPEGVELREHPFQLVGQGDRILGGGLVPAAEEPPFIDPIEGDLDARPTGGPHSGAWPAGAACAWRWTPAAARGRRRG